MTDNSVASFKDGKVKMIPKYKGNIAINIESKKIYLLGPREDWNDKNLPGDLILKDDLLHFKFTRENNEELIIPLKELTDYGVFKSEESYSQEVELKLLGVTIKKKGNNKE